jgi:hypothetical protein
VRGAVPLVVCVVGVAFAHEARAERGALTVEAAAGGQGSAVPTPLASPGGGRLAPTVMPHGSVGLRYALTHDLALGVSAGAEPWRWLRHEGVVVQELEGTLVHAYAAGWLVAVARWYVSGYDWRAYLEPRIGWSRRFYRHLDHRREVGGVAERYPLGVDAFVADDLLVGIGPGLEHVWDRTAMGVRGEGAILLGRDPAFHVRLVVYAAFDFYP